eukprot:Plantae.Rhodophyta-Palmaria_palmata.ctg7568.p2 GENE.Plantae.Rhodophyta-Palmaria_palmata.ctg7568~~Plantae.Rhodophyta-Palmaria_palmata.ctg7568.p2  ORF type:complete len:114 (-),score=9.21 Plantae.Rhodophyta-Palmaria_palmata.ctg7568:913-1254(-)
MSLVCPKTLQCSGLSSGSGSSSVHVRSSSVCWFIALFHAAAHSLALSFSMTSFSEDGAGSGGDIFSSCAMALVARRALSWVRVFVADDSAPPFMFGHCGTAALASSGTFVCMF